MVLEPHRVGRGRIERQQVPKRALIDIQPLQRGRMNPTVGEAAVGAPFVVEQREDRGQRPYLGHRREGSFRATHDRR